MADARAELATKDRKIAALELSLSEIQRQSALLADQLNRMCDEVEKSEKIYLGMETLSKENQNLKQEHGSLSHEIQTLKDELVQKENEITTLLDDNDKMVDELVGLGYNVQVTGENSSLKITPPANKTPPPKTSAVASSQPPKNTAKIPEDLSGLSIDELLNG